jgi:hypothetical protein
VAFTLGSRGATEAANKRSSDVMTSPQLQSAIAGQIFEACSEVVTVRFNFTGTDWQTMLFRGANGRVIRGTCVDAVRGSNWPLWAQVQAQLATVVSRCADGSGARRG